MTTGSADTYKELILFLATAGVVVPLFHRLKISPVLGFLGAGALLGPFGLGQLTGPLPWLSWVTIASSDQIAHVADFGIVVLLFTIGIELSWQRLRTLRRLVFGLGPLQVVACTATISALASLLTQSATAAVFIGLAMTLSSTAIVVPVIAAKRRLNTPAGRASFSILLFQDLAVAPILFAIGVLASGDKSAILASFATALLQAALALVLIVGIGRTMLRRLFQLVAATRSPELFMAACLLVVLGTGLITALSGLSMALGAFIAGLLLAETEYRRAVEAAIEPFKGLLLGVFFVTVGMGLDASRLIEAPLPILGAALALLILKGGIVFGLCRLFRLAPAVAAETGVLIGPGGEFAFVIVGAATAASLIPAELGRDVILVTTLTMIAIPGLARVGAGFGRKLAASQAVDPALSEPPPDEVGRVVIAGFGRVGQLVAEMLERHKVPYLAIDADPMRVAAARREGHKVYFGDGSRPEFLRVCGLERARGLVVTLDNARAVEAVVAAARAERPDLTIVARARDAKHASELYELGVDDAVPETIEASLQLSEAVLVDIGVPMGLVIASIHERRDEFRAVLKKKNEASEQGEFRARRTVGKR